MKTEMVGNP